MKRRVALLTTIPGPYRLPFFSALNERCDLNVLFDSMSEPNRQWVFAPEDFGFPYRVLKGVMLPVRRRQANSDANSRRFLQLRYNVIAELFRLRPDVVVSGEMGPRTLQAAFYCQITRTPLIIWWEGTPHTEGKASGVKTALRRTLVGKARRFWTNGVESSALLKTYGARERDLDAGMTGIDSARLRAATKSLIPNREAIRRELGVSGPTMMFLGTISQPKGVVPFLQSLDAVYRQGVRGWSALFVGGGPLEPVLKEWGNAHPGVNVVNAGFVQQAGLPRYFAAADSFVMPTLDDNWSLVAIEALAAGLPQIISIYNGCVSDLGGIDAIGHAVDPLDIAGFAARLAPWAARAPERISDSVAQPFVDYYGSQAQADRAFRSIEIANRKHSSAETVTSSAPRRP